MSYVLQGADCSCPFMASVCVLESSPISCSCPSTGSVTHSSLLPPRLWFLVILHPVAHTLSSGWLPFPVQSVSPGPPKGRSALPDGEQCPPFPQNRDSLQIGVSLVLCWGGPGDLLLTAEGRREVASSTTERGNPSERAAWPWLGHMWASICHGQAPRSAVPPHLPHTAVPAMPAPLAPPAENVFRGKTADAAKTSQYFMM